MSTRGLAPDSHEAVRGKRVFVRIEGDLFDSEAAIVKGEAFGCLASHQSLFQAALFEYARAVNTVWVVSGFAEERVGSERAPPEARIAIRTLRAVSP